MIKLAFISLWFEVGMHSCNPLLFSFLAMCSGHLKKLLGWHANLELSTLSFCYHIEIDFEIGLTFIRKALFFIQISN